MLHTLSFFIDMMRCIDCKRVAGICFGGILALLLERRDIGANQAAKLRAINDFTGAWYAAHPGSHRLPILRLSNVFIAEW